jgi:hypothetical protein
MVILIVLYGTGKIPRVPFFSLWLVPVALVFLMRVWQLKKESQKRTGNNSPLARLAQQFPDFVAEWGPHHLSDPKSLQRIIQRENAVLEKLSGEP